VVADLCLRPRGYWDDDDDDIIIIIIIIIIIMFVFGATAPSGAGSPHSQGF